MILVQQDLGKSRSKQEESFIDDYLAGADYYDVDLP